MKFADMPSVVMTLLAYEPLTEHGFALPLFGTSPSANALHVAVPSRPGDPAASIIAFDVRSTEASVSLELTQHRSASVGSVWLDVFLWDGVAHVGTRDELWKRMSYAHAEMERAAPLSLLALAEGADHEEVARCADLVHEWLLREWGSIKADRWRVDTYLMRLARRDLARRFDDQSTAPALKVLFQAMLLVQRQTILELRSPRILDFATKDLPELAFATSKLGWKLEIVLEDLKVATKSDSAELRAGTMLMRLRHGRGRTQTQIPLRVVDRFFGDERVVRDAQTGLTRTLTLSMTDGGRNTMKLQLPEIANMSDPVARFERRVEGIVFEIYDAGSAEGRHISNLLEEGLTDGSTLQTQGKATWWRMLP